VVGGTGEGFWRDLVLEGFLGGRGSLAMIRRNLYR
jgi:hypothetical protein